jgi:ribonucleoside-diphosphate reductase alpha chain
MSGTKGVVCPREECAMLIDAGVQSVKKERSRTPRKSGLFGDGAPSQKRPVRRVRLDARFFGDRVFTTAGTHPYDELSWTLRRAEIVNEKGETVFAQSDLEFPEGWSTTAVNVVASKYFKHRTNGERESSLKQLLDRVAGTIAKWGEEDGYFQGPAEAELFQEELTWLLVNQRASFNSPVWFNVGTEPHPQCSACFINAVEDTMESILELVKTEGMLFKYGSGSGVNLSPLRSCRERLSGGGIASGPVSFMKGFDAFAGAIKSGGKTRRAAKMVMLNVDHPDIREFVECKAKEEKKARALVELGFDGALDGEVYSSLFFQNANNSVRVSDRFMEAVLQDGDWTTREVTSGKDADTYRAQELLKLIAECAHYCGDPGLQFDDTVNGWHTCPNGGRINGSNPCSEYMFLDNSACNLASLNLLRFLDDEGLFDVERFRAAVDLLIMAQEIIIDRASYPTPLIGANSSKYRPLGLGYANLGALLMSRGLPYDSEEGRAYAAAVTALMTGEAYRMSAEIAGHKGPFDGFEPNRGPMLQVIRKHGAHLEKIDGTYVDDELLAACRTVWSHALKLGEKNGFRNAQASVLAPTGTIGFMMDCDTTGVEPDIALVKYKKLVGGGLMKIVNQSVPRALEMLGYEPEEIEEISAFVEANGTVEGCHVLHADHLPVFDCALQPAAGTRSIHYRGHLLMLGAVQPFISGAISKTVNVPKDATVDEIYSVYLEAWQLGLKAVSIYRDGSKVAQPMSTSKGSGSSVANLPHTKRRRLPDERQAITHKFSIAGHEGYVTVGMYEDGTPGEVFIVMAKQGSTVSGLMDAFATGLSIALQHGVPLSTLVEKFNHLRFEPAGFTNNPEIPMAKSVVDYISRWLASKFLTEDGKPKSLYNGHGNGQSAASTAPNVRMPRQSGASITAIVKGQEDAPICYNCGDVMVRNGTCYKCNTCGETSGCS